MSLDTLIVIGTTIPPALLGLMGYAVTTRPPTGKVKLACEVTFIILTLLSVSFIAWSGVRTNAASSRLENKVNDLSSQMERVAGFQGISKGQSAKDLADAIIDRFNKLQKKVDDAASSIAVVQNAAPDPNKIYQNNVPVATVQQGTISSDGKTIFFNILSNTINMDFDKTFYFRAMQISCQRVDIEAGEEMTDRGPLAEVRENVSCVVVYQ